MGMYTQVRGWLNVDSIGFDREVILMRKLFEAKESFEEQFNGRTWVCNDTVLHYGSNGSAYLFFGTELKNYDDDAENWIKHLIKYFPNAEGRIDFQYEEDEETCKYWLIYCGKVIMQSYCNRWCKGYGNTFELKSEF
jgi:hypothetical protein